MLSPAAFTIHVNFLVCKYGIYALLLHVDTNLESNANTDFCLKGPDIKLFVRLEILSMYS